MIKRILIVIIMALFRSDVINKEFIEKVLRKNEGTNRVNVNTLTVQGSQSKGSLLEERLDIQVNAQIKSRSKDYDWMAKVLRSEAGPANYSRFQGYLETEVNFYDKLIPELRTLGTPLPHLFPYLWGDYETHSKEVLLLERREDFNLAPLSSEGLDMPHVLLAIEWLAKLHGLTYVARKRFEKNHPNEDWQAKNPWIKKELEDSSNYTGMKKGGKKDFGDVTGGLNLKSRLIAMAKKALMQENKKLNDQFEKLVQSQDWLDEMRRESAKIPDFQGSFTSVCHGQPWIGNVYFKYDTDSNGQKVPVEALFTDFQNCAHGKTGQDLAHFLLSSTTREFRENHLETVLQAYLTELEDVLNNLGCFDEPLYNLTTLRRDYRRGIYLGISFCLFAMPMLSNAEVDGSLLEGLDATDGAQEMNTIQTNSLEVVGLDRATEAFFEYLNATGVDE